METVEKYTGNKNGKPVMIILDTKKGAGISYIEDIENNHCIGLPCELADKCISELEQNRELIQKGDM